MGCLYENVVENVQTGAQWTAYFVRFNHPGKKGLMSIETLHKEAFLASCDWKGYEESKITWKMNGLCHRRTQRQKPSSSNIKNIRHCLSNFQMSLLLETCTLFHRLALR